ncbi:hypothetical protein BJY01DRAFT_212729 [Aspergillus pseudoustus]|uniref:Uncharacterized protein n=1 Tax=Aspergillus pseudoustus TaxID=1810923 RepID=A0ABR4K4H3_9EURO
MTLVTLAHSILMPYLLRGQRTVSSRGATRPQLPGILIFFCVANALYCQEEQLRFPAHESTSLGPGRYSSLGHSILSEWVRLF